MKRRWPMAWRTLGMPLAIVLAAAVTVGGYRIYKLRAGSGPGVMRLDVMKRAADRGNARMQYAMGMVYFSGKRAAIDYVLAQEWFRKAAEGQCAEAYYPLAYLYATGKGEAADWAKAEKYLRLAAEQGVPEACYALASWLERGVQPVGGFRMEANPREAVDLYRTAAAAGLLEAQTAAGVMLARGSGVPVDRSEAVRLLELAARRGDPRAQYELGLLLEADDNPARTVRTAYRWHHKAAAAGYVPAVVRLAQTYAAGGVLEKNLDKALWWWKLAETLGEPGAPARCEALRNEVTSWQFARIENRILAWSPRVRAETHDDDENPKLPLL